MTGDEMDALIASHPPDGPVVTLPIANQFGMKGTFTLHPADSDTWDYGYISLRWDEDGWGEGRIVKWTVDGEIRKYGTSTAIRDITLLPPPLLGWGEDPFECQRAIA